MIRKVLRSKINDGIRKDYKIRPDNVDYFDGTSFDEDIIYQPDVYKFAGYIAEKCKLEYIIDIGAGNGEKLIEYREKYKIIAIDCDVNLKELKQNLPGHKIIDADLEKNIPKIDKEILSKSVVISSDVIEHIVDLRGYLKDLSDITRISPYVLLSTPARDRVRGIYDIGPPDNKFHVREWTATELNFLLRSYKFNNLHIGYTNNTNKTKDKTTLLCLAGKDVISKGRVNKLNKKTVQAIITLYNEEDIVEHTIKNLLSQGVDVHIIDNCSTDHSLKKVKKIRKLYPTRITFESFPKNKKDHNKYNWEDLLNRVDEVASLSSYEWIVHHDADEIRKSPFPQLNLQDAISQIDQLGYNLIDHTVIDFRPTVDTSGYKESENPERFFRHYEFGNRPGHFQQLKAWKNENERVNLSLSGGHKAVKNVPRVYPLKFLIKHYPLRSVSQARRKIFLERKPRLNKIEKERGWHSQYNSYKETDEFIWDELKLEKFHPVMYWQEKFVEQLSGIGINRK